MTKNEFLAELRKELAGLPLDDIERSIDYYSEIIDDSIEDGVSEEDAVAALDPPEKIALGIFADTPLPKLIKESVKPRRALRAWEIILIVLGSPVWVSLMIAVAAVIFSFYMTIWSIVITVFAVSLALISCTAAAIITIIPTIISGNIASGLMIAGVGLICAGLATFFFLLGCAVARGIVLLSRKIFMGIKRAFIRREA